MVCSLSTAKFFASLLNRRGYGAASRLDGVWAGSSEKSGSRTQDLGVKVVKEKDGENILEDKSGVPSSSWAPDPVTGFYKPCDSLEDKNPAELRELVFNHHRLNKALN